MTTTTQMPLAFCAGEGQSYTLKNHPDKTYPYITWEQLVELAEKPPEATEKAEGWWMLASSYCGHDARFAEGQGPNGRYHALLLDIDRGNHDKAAVVEVIEGLFTNAAYVIHSSRSATPDNKKWHVIIRLAETLSANEWRAMQAAVMETLDAKGFACDPRMVNPTQIFYLPNPNPAFYAWHISPGFTPATPSAAIQSRATELLARWIEQENNRQRKNRDEGIWSHHRAFRERHPTEQVLRECGFVTINGVDWNHPEQATSGYGTRLFDDGGLYTLSGTVASWGGRQTVNGGAYFDNALDLYVYFKLGGDKAAGEDYARRCLWFERYGTDDPGAITKMKAEGQQIADRLILTCKAKKEAERQEQERKAADARAEAEAMKAALSAAHNGDWIAEVPFQFDTDSPATEFDKLAWNAPGAIGEFVRHLAPTTPRKSLVPIFAGVLVGVAATYQGRVALRYKSFTSPTSLMVALIMGTGGGKESARDAYDFVTEATEGEWTKIAKRRTLKSGPAVYKDAVENPNLSILSSEFGAHAAASQGDRHAETALAALTDLSTSFTRKIHPSVGASQDTTSGTISAPTITAVLQSTPAKYFAATGDGDAESGWLGRLLPFHVEHVPWRFNGQTAPGPLTPSLQEWVDTARTMAPPYGDGPEVYETDNGGRCHLFTVPPEVNEYLGEIGHKCDVILHDPKATEARKQIAARAVEMISKLAFVVTMGCYRAGSPKELTMASVVWAEKLVFACHDLFAKTMEEHVAPEDQNETSRVRTRLRAQFQKLEDDPARLKDFIGNNKAQQDPDGRIWISQTALVESIVDKKGRPKLTSKVIREELKHLVDQNYLLEQKDLHRKLWLAIGTS